MLNLTVYETASVLGDLGWNDLLRAGEYYSSSEWLEYFRQLHAGYQAYGAVVADGQLRAGIALHEVGTDSHPLNRPDVCLTNWLAQEGSQAGSDPFLCAATARLMPTLSMGGRNPGTTVFLHDPSITDQEYSYLLEGFLDEAERIATEQRMRSIAFPFVEDPRMRYVLLRRGYVKYSTETYSMISLENRSSFDEYVELSGRKARQQIKSDRRKINASEWTYQVVRLEDSPLEELCRLQTMNANQHGVPGGFEEAIRKQQLVMQVLPGRSWAAISRDPKGRIGSFSIFIRWHDELYSRQGGVDLKLTGGYPAFFETAFYQLIEHGIATGATSIHYSVTSEHSKKLRGCNQRPQEGFIMCLDTEDHKWLRDTVR